MGGVDWSMIYGGSDVVKLTRGREAEIRPVFPCSAVCVLYLGRVQLLLVLLP
jgi:hypothetical protein